MSHSKIVSFDKLCYGAQFKYSAEEAAVWVKIGHNTVAGWKPEYVSDSWTGQPICAFAEDDQLDTDVFLVTPTPVEDVRAVGDEPVGYAGLNGLKTLRGSDGYLIVSVKPERYLDIPLYRHPQRQVVLPERWTSQHFPPHMSRGDVAIRVEIQNACIAEFERLNK